MAGDYDSAASVLTEIDFDYLLLWGHYRLMIDLHESLQEKINDKNLARISANDLGLANWCIGKINIAIQYYEKMLESARQDNAKQHEGTALGNLGLAYDSLGDVRKAIEFYEQALVIAREIGDQWGEGNQLGNLGFSYTIIGETHKAIKQLEQALIINRNIGDRTGESNNLGSIGLALLSQEDYQKALDIFQQSIHVGDEISNTRVQIEERWGLSQIYLFQDDLINAHATIKAALQYNVPEYNHNANALHGIIAMRQGDASAAHQSFTRAIAQADEILAVTPEYYDALDAKGLALSGLVICDLRLKIEEPEQDKLLSDAVETFRKARKIAPHAGIVKRNLRLFDELAKCDPEGLLEGVREAVEGK